MRLFLTSLLILTLSISVSQNVVKRNDSIPVIVNNDTLRLAWASGLNSAQISEIDLNNDGKLDLFLFEANNEYNPITGDKTYMFINKGGSGEMNYVFDPSYRDNFPVLEDYTLLRDYNCDGKPDIFTWNILQRFYFFIQT